MIASKSCLGHYLFFLPRELRNPFVFVLPSSKNKNNNGFVLVGLNSFSFDYRCVLYFYFADVSFIVFFVIGCCRLDEIFAY